MRLSKRGATKTLWWLIDLVLLAICIGIFFMQLANFAASSYWERVFLSKDIAFTTNSVYASPNVVVYVYPTFSQNFNIKFEKNSVGIIDPEIGDPSSKSFPFIEDKNIEFVYKEINNNLKVKDSEDKKIYSLAFYKQGSKIEPLQILLTSNVLNGDTE